jgi:hypothetical protein
MSRDPFALIKALPGYRVRPWEPWTNRPASAPWSGRWSAKLKALLTCEAALMRYLNSRDGSEFRDAFTRKAYIRRLLQDYRELATGLREELAELRCRDDEALASPEFGAWRRNGEFQFVIVASSETRSFGEFERRAGEFAERVAKLPYGVHPQGAMRRPLRVTGAANE